MISIGIELASERIPYLRISNLQRKNNVRVFSYLSNASRGRKTEEQEIMVSRQSETISVVPNNQRYP